MPTEYKDSLTRSHNEKVYHHLQIMQTNCQLQSICIIFRHALLYMFAARKRASKASQTHFKCQHIVNTRINSFKKLQRCLEKEAIILATIRHPSVYTDLSSRASPSIPRPCFGCAAVQRVAYTICLNISTGCGRILEGYVWNILGICNDI